MVLHCEEWPPENAESKKREIPQVFDGISPTTRHYPLHGEIAKRSERGIIWSTKDDVIEDFNLEQLARANEIACDFDVRFRRLRDSARMVVLCGAPIYVE